MPAPLPVDPADLIRIPASVVLRRPVRVYASALRVTPRAVQEAIASAHNTPRGTLAGRVLVIRHYDTDHSAIRSPTSGVISIVGTISLVRAIAPVCDVCECERARLVVRREGWGGPPSELCPACAQVPGYVIGLLTRADGAICPLGGGARISDPRGVPRA